MDNKRGWIKLYRDIQDHWVYQDPAVFRMWVDILMMANHEPRKVELKTKKQLITVGRGQFWTSYRSLSRRWGMSDKTIKKWLTLLQGDGMIYIDSKPNSGTLVTVRNYAVYQDFSEDDDDNVYDKGYDNVYDKVSTKVTTKVPIEQELKNISTTKNGKKIYGRPGDPDYAEEV